MAKNEIGENYALRVVVMKIDGTPGLEIYSNIKKFWNYLEKNFDRFERKDPRFQTFDKFEEIGSYSTFMKYFRITNRMQLRVRNTKEQIYSPFISWKNVTVQQFQVK